MEKLHPGARWLFRLNAYIVLAFVGIFIAIFLGVSLANFFGEIAIVFAIVIWIFFVFGIGEIYARVSYNNWTYEFTSTNLKLERGVVWKKYSNIPYERVQNVDIHRGILARMLGFSSMDVQTAGAHMTYGRGAPRSEGNLPAISSQNAEKFREFLMKKIGHKNS